MTLSNGGVFRCVICNMCTSIPYSFHKDRIAQFGSTHRLTQSICSPFLKYVNIPLKYSWNCIWDILTYINNSTVEEPLIKDPPSRGHNRNNLSIKDTFKSPKCSFSHIINTFWTSEERVTLSTKDKMAGSNVSFGQTPPLKGQVCQSPNGACYRGVPLY